MTGLDLTSSRVSIAVPHSAGPLSLADHSELLTPCYVPTADGCKPLGFRPRPPATASRNVALARWQLKPWNTAPAYRPKSDSCVTILQELPLVSYRCCRSAGRHPDIRLIGIAGHWFMLAVHTQVEPVPTTADERNLVSSAMPQASQAQGLYARIYVPNHCSISTCTQICPCRDKKQSVAVCSQRASESQREPRADQRAGQRGTGRPGCTVAADHVPYQRRCYPRIVPALGNARPRPNVITSPRDA